MSENTLDVENELAIVRCNESIKSHLQEMGCLMGRKEVLHELIRNEERKKLTLGGCVYYVYIVFVEGSPVYVGKGKGVRYKHAVSGTSSVSELNRDFFQDKYIEVLFVREGMTEPEALSYENEWIGYVQSMSSECGYNSYNKTACKNFRYWDIPVGYFYHNVMVHAIDNKGRGIKRVEPQNFNACGEAIYD